MRFSFLEVREVPSLTDQIIAVVIFGLSTFVLPSVLKQVRETPEASRDD